MKILLPSRLPALLVALAFTCLPVAKTYALISAPLAPPTNLVVTIEPAGRAVVTWEASLNSLTYYVMRSANGGPWERVAVTGLTRFEDQMAPRGTSYAYAVYGEERNSVGSRFTPSIYVTPAPLPSAAARGVAL